MGCLVGLLNMVSDIQKCLHSISKDKDKMQKHPTTNDDSTFFTCCMIASLLLLFRQKAIWNVRSDIWIDFKSPPHQIFLLLSAG